MNAVLEWPGAEQTSLRTCVHRRFTKQDGVAVSYWHWPAAGTARGTMVMLHQLNEPSDGAALWVNELDLPDVEFFAWGSPTLGLGACMGELQAFMEHLTQEHRVELARVFVLAHEVGAVVAAAWVQGFAPGIRGLSLISPPLGLGRSTWRQAWLAKVPTGLPQLARRVMADASAILVPTQMALAGTRPGRHRAALALFFERLSSRRKEWVDDAMDAPAQTALAKHQALVTQVRAFADGQWVMAPATGEVQLAVRVEGVRDAGLAQGALTWLAGSTLSVGAYLSHGLGLVRHTGLDSAATLDHMDRRVPKGWSPLGRWLDRHFIESSLGHVVRARKAMVQELLLLAMRRVRVQDMPLHLMDIAAGHGRTVLDAVAASRDWPDSILLLDGHERQVKKGRSLITSRGIQDVARFERANALASGVLFAIVPAATVVCVCGLYEQVSDRELLASLLQELAQFMPQGACLIYTNRLRQSPWEASWRAMGGAAHMAPCRTQVEMDQLVAAAGFAKINQRMDEAASVTVALAVRR